jgi:UDP-2,4-diacetamido-2,4,6-trideoxy-beta-L-altropyranose hydrolase
MDEPKSCAFRVDASYEIGSGHVNRCLALAQALRNLNIVCIFISRNNDGNLNHLIKSEGFVVEELKFPADDSELLTDQDFMRQDAVETINALKERRFDWLIVDHYKISIDWEIKVKDFVLSVMVVDDLANREHYCDVLLDQNLDADREIYESLTPDNCLLLLGPEYALIRPNFAKLRERSLLNQANAGIRRILINFGGGNPRNAVVKALHCLSMTNIDSSIVINVVLGGLGKKTRELDRLIVNSNNKIFVFGWVGNMVEMLSETDLVIGAGGSSAWERCCLGVPSINFSLAANQQRIVNSIEQREAGYSLCHADFLNGELEATLDNIFLNPSSLLKISKNASMLCDGYGIGRVLSSLKFQ